MTNAFIVLSTMAMVLLFVAFRQHKHIIGLQTAKGMFLNVLPLLVCAFVIVGFISVLIPKEALQGLVGQSAGWKGLIIGPLVGALFQGGPFAFFPMYGAIFRDNVSTGTAVAMITAWGMINIGHVPYELTFLGSRFVVLKYAFYIALPSLSGLLASLLFG